MTNYIIGTLVWLCISSAVAITSKDALLNRKWISKDDIRRTMGDGKAKQIMKFVAINMIPVFRAFACVAIIIMSIVDKEDIVRV